MVSVKCWAAPLGSCSQSQSREHLISRAILDEGPVQVQGFPWCRDEPRTVGVRSFTSKILCTKHNNSLSHADFAGVTAFRAFASHQVYTSRRLEIKRSKRRGPIKTFRIDGQGLELWMMKTAINLCYACDLFPRDPLHRLPSEMVETVFGRRPLCRTCGLYLASSPTERLTPGPTWGFIPLITPELNLVGGIFDIRGWRFVFFIEAPPRHHSFQFASNLVADPSYNLAHRPERLRTEDGSSSLLSVIRFDWAAPSNS